MSRLRSAIVTQFSKPVGLLGSVAGGIMAHRPSNRERALRTLDLLAIEEHHSVLEIGFGPGVAIARALELAPHGFVTGIDHSEVMLRQARRRNRRSIEEGRLELKLASVESLPELPRSFDRIFSINSIGFWKEPVPCLTFLRQELNPSGRLAITVQPRGRNASAAAARDTAEKLARWLRDAGLAQVETHIVELQPVPAACVIGRR